MRISGSNAGYTMFRGSVKGTGYPLHSPVSPSLPLPCVTVCHHISTGLHHSASNSTVTGLLSQAERGRVVNLTVQLHLPPWLKASIATPLLVLYAFMARKGTYVHSQKDCAEWVYYFCRYLFVTFVPSSCMIQFHNNSFQEDIPCTEILGIPSSL